jgi:hypothetical protein
MENRLNTFQIEEYFLRTGNDLFNSRLYIEESDDPNFYTLRYYEMLRDPETISLADIVNLILENNKSSEKKYVIISSRMDEDPIIDVEGYVSESEIKRLLKQEELDLPFYSGLEAVGHLSYLFIALVPKVCDSSFIYHLGLKCQEEKNLVTDLLP